MTREDLLDLVSDALGDSMDVDWNYATGARYVVDALIKEGLVTPGEETKQVPAPGAAK